jgi:hypothetical protein
MVVENKDECHGIEILALASGRVPILFTVSTHLLVYSTITVDTNAV